MNFIYNIEHNIAPKKVWRVNFLWSALEVVEEEKILNTLIRHPCFNEPQMKKVAREAWSSPKSIKCG